MITTKRKGRFVTREKGCCPSIGITSAHSKQGIFNQIFSDPRDVAQRLADRYLVQVKEWR